MLRIFLVAAGGIFLMTGAAAAQTVATDEDLTLRPGDKVTWTTSSPHRLQVGGLAQLTPLQDVSKVLDLPPDVAISGDTGVAPSGTPITATVKADAAAAGVPTFNFTCGFGPHRSAMISKPFKIVARNGEPEKQVRIESRSGPNRWVLIKDTEIPLSALHGVDGEKHAAN